MTPPTPAITFTPSTSGGGARLSLARNNATTATTLVLDLRAQDVSQLYGVAFDLSYPSSVLRYSRAAEGTFLASGSSTTFQVAEVSTGHLVVGLSRIGPTGGVDGSGLVLSLEFTAANAGSGALTFSENLAFSPNGLGQNGVAWDGGTVQVTR